MSPEQVRGEAVDHRSDIFSFGTVLYEMLSGRRAFQGDTAVEVQHAILTEEPPDITDPERGLARHLKHLVRHCLEKKPEERSALFQKDGDQWVPVPVWERARTLGTCGLVGLGWAGRLRVGSRPAQVEQDGAAAGGHPGAAPHHHHPSGFQPRRDHPLS
jgi:hypothetical protein